MVALTRCWKWNKGWKGDAAGKQAQHDSILRRLPSVLQEVQAAASQGTASGSGGGTASGSAQPPDLAAVQAHIMAALETDLLDKIMALVEQWPQYYGSVTRALAEELVPKGLCLNPAGEYLACGESTKPDLRQSGQAGTGTMPLRPLTTTKAPEPEPAHPRRALQHQRLR